MSASGFWARSRARRDEGENAAAAGIPARAGELTATDRCDRCGAQAYVRVLLPSRLELLFCAHHNREHARGRAGTAAAARGGATPPARRPGGR